MPPTVADLIRDKRIEQVPVDVYAAWERLDEAKIHLQSSAILAATDPSMAYVALYDAARKALTALMDANGYRTTNTPGAHQTVGFYGVATITSATATPHVQSFDRMRLLRNSSEYRRQKISQAMLQTDLEHAREIVNAVQAQLPPDPRLPTSGT